VDEQNLDAATAMISCVPAYVYLLVEALTTGGIRTGLSAEQSRRMAEQVVHGAAAHMKSSQFHPAVLREQVTTPGGMTVAGIMELEKSAFRHTIATALEAAATHAQQRSARLAAEFARG
jgi:pyrroline-5-carboxylate reductase